jgi:hypothetical protein
MSRFHGYWTLILKQPKNKQIIHSAFPSTLPLTSTASQPFSSLLDYLSIPQLPVPPTDCCMSGCKKCVWDIYTEDFNSTISGLELLLSKKMDKDKRKDILAFIQTAELELIDPV